LNYSEVTDVLEVNYYFYAMIFQQFLLALIFAGALFYLGRLIYKSFQAKSGCASGCGKCSAVDFSKIEQQIKERKL
jgi:hypothetical protein